MSNQFLLEDIDANIEEEALTLATKVLEVPKEEMEEETTVLDVPKKRNGGRRVSCKQSPSHYLQPYKRSL